MDRLARDAAARYGTSSAGGEGGGGYYDPYGHSSSHRSSRRLSSIYAEPAIQRRVDPRSRYANEPGAMTIAASTNARENHNRRQRDKYYANKAQKEDDRLVRRVEQDLLAEESEQRQRRQEAERARYHYEGLARASEGNRRAAERYVRQDLGRHQQDLVMRPEGRVYHWH
ncbi:hypothetical protein B0A48_15971 [Cryoendolithus antarcticus]|uniref:Uncharacterized protein n=1 Tax=Cryoendolithus antarcticus TaxID=1507870 RepID=A0A1V8SGD8_9PEZI|nr:hypothetical protein B0A48_15971 [Cryoendolithus antarcticus]